MTLSTAAALAGFIGVALGAFGAHALDGHLSIDGQNWWETATLYLLVHVSTTFAVGASEIGRLRMIGGWVMLGGALLFSATLYAMALGAPRFLGAITPLGGLCLLIGWALVAISARHRKSPGQSQQS
ncbi:MAG: DUF423 domain-containing protein [Pseudomonadota bacterium]